MPDMLVKLYDLPDSLLSVEASRYCPIHSYAKDLEEVYIMKKVAF